MGPGETYSAAETAKILRLTSRRVMQLLERGEHEAFKHEAFNDGARRWRFDQRSVHDNMLPAPARRPTGDPKGPTGGRRTARQGRDLLRLLGRLEGRIEYWVWELWGC